MRVSIYDVTWEDLRRRTGGNKGEYSRWASFERGRLLLPRRLALFVLACFCLVTVRNPLYLFTPIKQHETFSLIYSFIVTRYFQGVSATRECRSLVRCQKVPRGSYGSCRVTDLNRRPATRSKKGKRTYVIYDTRKRLGWTCSLCL